MAGLFLFPSLEAALIEVSLLLTERERELGGERITVPYGQMQEPALDRMAKVLSSSGLDTRAKSAADLMQAATWLPEIKSKTLLAAWAEDDRFTGRVLDVRPIRTAFFAEGFRIPVISVNSGSQDWRLALPASYEIRIYDVRLPSATDDVHASEYFATIAVVGERLRLEPRLAPLSMDAATLSRIERLIIDDHTLSPSIHTAESLAVEDVRARAEIESFEAAVAPPFQPWWSPGENRRLDRVILTSAEHDGSFVVGRLKAALVASGVSAGLIDSGIFSLSGCVMEDERRQEWLRTRGEDAWAIRGSVHISLELIRALPMASWRSLLANAVTT